MDLTIILPCYNEVGFIREAVDQIKQVLNKTVYKYEIIIAEDSSTDGTDKIAKDLADNSNNIIWLHRDQRIGRGSAVSNAIKKARGNIVGFIDVDLEAPAHYILPIVSTIEQGADIAYAVRYLKIRWFDYILRLPRLLSHYIYSWISRLLLNMTLQDTEVGFKFFKRQRILPILDEIKDRHWFWDTEVMVRPFLKGYKIEGVPILFTPNYNRKSKVNLIKDSINHLRNLIKFRKELNSMKEVVRLNGKSEIE